MFLLHLTQRVEVHLVLDAMIIPHFAGDLQWQLYDLLGHRNEWWVPGKLVDLRQRLESYWRVSVSW